MVSESAIRIVRRFARSSAIIERHQRELSSYSSFPRSLSIKEFRQQASVILVAFYGLGDCCRLFAILQRHSVPGSSIPRLLRVMAGELKLHRPPSWLSLYVEVTGSLAYGRIPVEGPLFRRRGFDCLQRWRAFCWRDCVPPCFSRPKRSSSDLRTTTQDGLAMMSQPSCLKVYRPLSRKS